jgi:hypothetical protein
VFNTLRLSVEVLAEVLAIKVLAVEVLAEVFAEILVEILAELAAEIAAEIAGGTELEVLFVAVRYWDSLESYTSFSTQFLVKSICALFLR